MIKYLKESGKTLEPYRLLDVRERKLFKDAEDKLNVVLRGHQANENSNQRLLALAPVLSNIFLPTHATEIAAIAVGYAHQELDKIVEFSSELLDQPGETRATALVKMASKAYLINRSTVERIPNPPMEIKDLISLGADIIRLRANILADRGDSRASQHLGEVNLPKVESEKR